MIRYLRLFLYFVEFSFSKSFQFRLDFFFRVVMDCIYYAVNLSFYQVIFSHVGTLGGWSKEQAMVFVAGYLFVDAVQMTLFSNNLWGLPQIINRGDLDYYLVRPASSLFFLCFRDFAANSFLNLLITIGILFWAFAGLPQPLNIFEILWYFVLLVHGTFIFLAMQLLFMIPIFWTHSVDGLRHIPWQLTRVSERPDRIFRGFVRKLFTLVLPMSLIASFPARLVLEPFDWQILAHLFSVSAVLWVVVISFWRFGLKNYSSASS